MSDLSSTPIFERLRRLFCEVATEVLARIIIPAILFFAASFYLFSPTNPRILASENSESEVYSPPPGRLAKAKANLDLVNFAAMKLAIEDLAPLEDFTATPDSLPNENGGELSSRRQRKGPHDWSEPCGPGCQSLKVVIPVYAIKSSPFLDNTS